eukprot:GHVU01168334.1.p1 GENE.GHVU01168334.1~~GHVU01168334.1.p1  ORF type:complete len:367 (+),score=47.19 GHVU01168334.1:344-1444(+)
MDSDPLSAGGKTPNAFKIDVHDNSPHAKYMTAESSYGGRGAGERMPPAKARGTEDRDATLVSGDYDTALAADEGHHLASSATAPQVAENQQQPNVYSGGITYGHQRQEAQELQPAHHGSPWEDYSKSPITDAGSDTTIASSEGNGNMGQQEKRKKGQPKYDSMTKLTESFPRLHRRILEFTELPYLILWTYFAYWLIIVIVFGPSVPGMIWLSSAVAGTLVGIGLNANAYRYVFREGRVDYPVIIRFFLIPFGVSSLSGISNSLRENFLLVFPRDPPTLAISIAIPAAVVCLLFLLRVVFLIKKKVRLCFRVLFLNGHLTDHPATIKRRAAVKEECVAAAAAAAERGEAGEGIEAAISSSNEHPVS